MSLTEALLEAGYEVIQTPLKTLYIYFQKPNGLIKVSYNQNNDQIVMRYHYDSDDNVGFLFNSFHIMDASLDIANTMRTINSFETIAQTLKSAYDDEFHNK